MATVVLAGTFDTKGPEHEFVRDVLLSDGVDVIAMDLGITGKPSFTPDISAQQVIAKTGRTLDELQFQREGSGTRDAAIEAMSEAAAQWLNLLYEQGKCDAVLGMGGSGGSNLLCGAMRSMPLGVPKFIVSTMMAGDIRRLVAGSDIAMLNAVTDIAGLNRISRPILANAAHAAAGMARHHRQSISYRDTAGKPLVGITMYGITTKGVTQVLKRLEQSGFEVIVFHANGTGGPTMERLVEQGLIDGVVDYTLGEMAGHMGGGKGDCGPNRLLATARSGVPQVIVPGGLDVLNFYGEEYVPDRYKTPERRMIRHNPTTVAVRMLKHELEELGSIIGQRVSDSAGPVSVALPLQGLDSCSEPGGPWYDPEANDALLKAIKDNLRPNIPVRELDLNANDPAFGDAVADMFLQLWACRGSAEPGLRHTLAKEG